MITGVMKTEESTKYYKEVTWTFHDLERRVEEGSNLLSDVISLGQEEWRVLLHIVDLLDSRYINISLSRVAISGKILIFSSICWHGGILDRDGLWQYDRSGLVRQKATSNEWMTVADWSGPEWTHMAQEKDLYMPDGRLKFVLQFCWDPKCLQKDSEGTTMKPIDLRLTAKNCGHYFKRAFWIIDDVQRRLEEDKTLLSDTFSFGGQLWRLSLGTVELLDAQYMDIALSAVTKSNILPPFRFICWHSGIVDRNGTCDYYRCGLTTSNKTFTEWTRVVDWFGPELKYLHQEKDLYMPLNLLTIAFCLRWTPEIRKISKTVGRLETGVNAPDFKQVFWKIDDLKYNIENSDIMLSDVFQFKRHNWLLRLKTMMLNNAMHIKISLLRTSNSDETVLGRSLWWHIGILGTDKDFHYDCSGWAANDTETEECTKEAECSTLAEWNSLKQNEDVLIPENCLTVSLVFSCLGPVFEFENRMNQEKTVSLSLNPKDAYQTEREYDLIVNVNDRLFRTQRLLLHIFSPIMASMVYTRETDGRNEILYLPDCDPKAFEIFLIFANSGDLSGLTNEVAEKVYYIANKYDVPDLKKNCTRHLWNRMSVKSVCACLDLAHNQGITKLEMEATEFFVSHARDIFHTPEWLQFMVTNTKLANNLIIRSYDNAMQEHIFDSV